MTSNGPYYRDLGAIIDANREEQREWERSGIPGTGGMLTCPNCGSLLKYSETRRLWSCVMGDWQGTTGPRQT